MSRNAPPAQIPEWLLPHGKDEWLFGYLHDQDAVVVPVAGEQCRFAPSIVTHRTFYEGGPFVPLFKESDAVPDGFSLQPPLVRFRGAGTVIDLSEPVLDIGGVRLVWDTAHPYAPGEVVEADGMVEIETWDSYESVDEEARTGGHGPVQMNWQFLAIGAWIRNGDGEHPRLEQTQVADHGQDAGGRFVVRCRRVST